MNEEQKFERAKNLMFRLDEYVGKGKDSLSLYRKYLDESKIESEDEDGFPNSKAYSEENIQGFLKGYKEIKDNK